jgi:hypothetical protein
VVVVDPPDDPAGAPTTGTGRVVEEVVDAGDADAAGADGGAAGVCGPVTMVTAPVVAGVAVVAVGEGDAGGPVGVGTAADPAAAVAAPGVRSRWVDGADGGAPGDECSTPPPATTPRAAPAAITTAATTPAPATLFSMVKA